MRRRWVGGAAQGEMRRDASRCVEMRRDAARCGEMRRDAARSSLQDDHGEREEGEVREEVGLGDAEQVRDTCDHRLEKVEGG